LKKTPTKHHALFKPPSSCAFQIAAHNALNSRTSLLYWRARSFVESGSVARVAGASRSRPSRRRLASSLPNQGETPQPLSRALPTNHDARQYMRVSEIIFGKGSKSLPISATGRNSAKASRSDAQLHHLRAVAFKARPDQQQSRPQVQVPCFRSAVIPGANPDDGSPCAKKEPGSNCLEPGIYLATTYSHRTYRPTTIGAAAFHFRVRNGTGWFHRALVTRG
jgi:hypothetical protein